MFPETSTYASHVTVCAVCHREVQGLTKEAGKLCFIVPCGHPANMTIIENQKLPKS